VAAVVGAVAAGVASTGVALPGSSPGGAPYEQPARKSTISGAMSFFMMHSGPL
jgi:hypothetical protein